MVEAVRPHSFHVGAKADEHFLYVNMSIHNETRPGSAARTNMYMMMMMLLWYYHIIVRRVPRLIHVHADDAQV